MKKELHKMLPADREKEEPEALTSRAAIVP